jgi:NADP-dependent 3-hydroxy acid dehydrogenase YdfG
VDKSDAVLITGCSSGIGAATAAELVRHGFTVYATARKPDTLAELAELGCRTLALDVTDEASMAAAVAEVERAAGAVGALINNAGYSQSGAVESVPLDEVRRQFETNVFGLIRMSQLVLPGMREARRGRIVNIGSMGGKLTFPGGGVYHATKYALEAISDAMRFELQGFGVDVVLIEPGLITTEFAHAATTSMESIEGDGPYAHFNGKLADTMASVYNGPIAKALGGDSDAVAKTIRKALEAKRPRTRYTVTASAKLGIAQRAITPDRLWDLAMRTQFPVPRP